MLATEYRQCTRCVMDTTDPDIVFDESGHCNHCNAYFSEISGETYSGESSDKQLAEIVERIKAAGRGKDYDCLVGISGGIDSCYTAYLCKKLGLRPLLLHLDNGWDSEIAVSNIQKIAEKLGLDYMSYVLDWEEFREIQLAFLRSSIVDLEMPTDIAIPASLFETASKYGIKYIISGGNYTSEGILPIQWGYHVMKDMKLYRHIVARYSRVKRKKVPAVGFVGETWYKFARGIRTIYLLNYVPYNKDEARRFLEQELGWQYYGGKHYESRYTGFWQSYMLPEKWNIDYRKATLSTQICAGQVTREEALEVLSHPPYDPKKAAEDKSYICKKLGISTDEFDRIMQEKPLTYKAFPNEEKRIERVYALYRSLFPNKRL
jgi:N-acetyl sugar amidotransferase